MRFWWAIELSPVCGSQHLQCPGPNKKILRRASFSRCWRSWNQAESPKDSGISNGYASLPCLPGWNTHLICARTGRTTSHTHCDWNWKHWKLLESSFKWIWIQYRNCLQLQIWRDKDKAKMASDSKALISRLPGCQESPKHYPSLPSISILDLDLEQFLIALKSRNSHPPTACG